MLENSNDWVISSQAPEIA